MEASPSNCRQQAPRAVSGTAVGPVSGRKDTKGTFGVGGVSDECSDGDGGESEVDGSESNMQVPGLRRIGSSQVEGVAVPGASSVSGSGASEIGPDVPTPALAKEGCCHNCLCKKVTCDVPSQSRRW